MIDYAARVEAVRGKLREKELDALVVTHPSNRFWLTGFTAHDTAPNESSGHLVITASDALLVTGSVNVTQAAAQAPHIRVETREGGWGAADSKALLALGVKRAGYEAQAMLDGVLRGIDAELTKAGKPIGWIAVDGLVEEFRAVKTADELDLLRKAFEITCAAFERVAPTIQVGQTEWEVAWKIHQAYVDLGSEGPAFPTIVASGTHGARPHHEPGERRIEAGVPIVIDMGARYHGYNADLTRTVWLGEPDAKLREVYSIVDGAVEAVFERLHAGMTGKEMDAAARDYINARGYEKEFSHGLGHGVGVRVHEGPSASKDSTDVLAPGNVITIEPGIYLPEWGGVRIEDVVLITEDGFEVLTSAASKQRIPT
jgi:Xaa-Pro aminopeptidase